MSPYYASPRQQMSKNPMLKVVILGDGGVGKSCLMNCFVNNQFEPESFHTIGVEFLNKNIMINNETYTLQIWDTAGQERFKSLRTPFYRGSDICMLTYAVNDQTSFRNLMLWRNEFLYYADVKDGRSFPFILVGNKDDVPEQERQVSYAEAMAWCQENGNPPFVETSAKTAANVELAFNIAVKHWAKLEASLDKPYIGETIDLGHQPTQQRYSCCYTSSSD